MKRGRTSVLEEINITPLTDIFLVLLIIMMVVMPLYSDRQLSVNMQSVEEGETSTAEDSDDSKTVLVAIDELGAFTIDGAPVPSNQLTVILGEKIQQKPEGMILQTHVDAPFAAMTQAMDAAEILQVKDVTIVKTSGEPEEAAPAEK
ncbi:MAG: biopolymer transporter ExbD [Candidatus Hydrogenedentes bacterium]|nr:biopolymer transporter ExbD [Candidatus Hydrogenedentota bacterium]